MKKSSKYESAVKDAKTLESVIPKQLAEYTTRALSKLNEALGGDVGGYVANRLHMSHEELREALAAEQIDGVALAIYNIEKRWTVGSHRRPNGYRQRPTSCCHDTLWTVVWLSANILHRQIYPVQRYVPRL